MGKVLIIAEKPSVAGDLAKALGGVAKDKSGDFYEGEKYVISSAVGHLLELIVPEEHDIKRGKWTFAALPHIPPQFGLQPIERSADRLKVLVKLIKRKDVDALINACDAGREGELIFRRIVDYTHIRRTRNRHQRAHLILRAQMNGPPVLAANEARKQHALAHRQHFAAFLIAQRFPHDAVQLDRALINHEPQPQRHVERLGHDASLFKSGLDLRIGKQALRQQPPVLFAITARRAQRLEIECREPEDRSHVRFAVRAVEAQRHAHRRVDPLETDFEFDKWGHPK